MFWFKYSHNLMEKCSLFCIGLLLSDHTEAGFLLLVIKFALNTRGNANLKQTAAVVFVAVVVVVLSRFSTTKRPYGIMQENV